MSVPPHERPQPPEEEGGKAPASHGASARPPRRALRPELRNWQVVETEAEPGVRAGDEERAPERESTGEALAIEGEAHRVESAQSVEPVGPAPAPDDHPAAANDQVDSILIAGLPERRFTVKPGGKATIVVSLLNNGPQPAIFDIHVEGWVHESWLPEGARHIPVHPGERTAATLTLAPPRQAVAAAGEFPIYVVVRSPQHLRRTTRLAATLVILPFTEFGVGRLSPTSVELGFFRRRAVFRLPISNLGNHPTRLQAQGQAAGAACSFAFQRGSSGWQPGPVLIDLAADETIDLLVQATLQAPPLLAARPLSIPLKVSLNVADELRPPRTAPADATYTAPIRVWHLVTLAAAAVMMLAITGMLALAARLLLGGSAPVAAAQPAAAPAPVVIVLNQAPPQPAPIAATSATPAVAPAAGPATVNGAPVVQADQVTAPGQPARALGGPRAPATDSSALTYAQMFQEIALRYDLDWRLLAAQAYVESAFDTMALGSDGDMGLMQVLPSTWREWAPTVGASDPFDAYSNTLVAAAYLDHVRAQMGARGLPQAQWMLVGYNWGPDRLADFVDGGGTWEQLPSQRAQYASDILNIARTIP